MNDGLCRCCGKSLADCRPNAIYCSPRCSRRWRTVGGAPFIENETTILVERRKLDTAPRACRRCTCEHPLGLVDADGEVRCFKCAWPLERGEVDGLPSGHFPAAA